MPKKREPTLREYVVALGLPPLVFAIFFAMTGYINFWVGIIGASLAGVFFLIDWILWSGRFPLWLRACGVCAGISALALLGWMALRGAPLSVIFSLGQAPYATGTDIGGIKWQPNFTEARLLITNGAEDPYRSVDIRVRTDLIISQAGQLDKLNQCKIAPDFPIGSTYFAVFGPDGKTVERQIPWNLSTTGYNIFRIYCDQLIPNVPLDIIFAVVPVPSNPTKVKPSWFTAKIHFEGVGRSRTHFVPQCFEGACPDMPTSDD